MLRFPIVFAAIVLIAGVGVIADIHPENFVSRLLLQTLAVTTVVIVLPPEMRVLPILPLTVERIGLVIVRTVVRQSREFHGRLDWMTVAEVVPVTAALAAIGLLAACRAGSNRREPGALRRDDRFCLF